MAQPIAGYEFDITALGSSGDDVNHLFSNVKIEGTANLAINGAALIAGPDSGGRGPTVIGGLYDWEVSFDWLFPSSPQTGYELFVTMASSYDNRPRSFQMSMVADEFEITEGNNSSPPVARSFMPGQWLFSGSYVCLVDDTTVLTNPTAPGTASESATFKITEEGATDNALTASVIAQQVGLPIARQGVMEVTYGFTVNGDLTVVGATNFLPAGAIATPTWEDGSGTPDVSLTGQLTSGQTFSGNVFGRQHDLSVVLGEPIRGTTTLRGIGALSFS